MGPSSPGGLAELLGDDLDIDLSDVTRVDTSGLATLVEVFQVARRKGREVHLAHLNGPVREMVRLAHLEDLFSTLDTLDGLDKRSVKFP